MPYCVFTDPELGRVGLTERQAREQGCKIRVAKMPMSYVARAREMDETRGLMKVLVDAETDQILGGAILGVWGGEIMTQLQLAMMGKLHLPGPQRRRLRPPNPRRIPQQPALVH